MDKVDDKYKKAFNLGYEIAKELELKKPLFKNQNKIGEANNPIQAGMLQYVNENSMGINAKVANSQSNSMERVKGKNTGKGLSI